MPKPLLTAQSSLYSSQSCPQASCCFPSLLPVLSPRGTITRGFFFRSLRRKLSVGPVQRQLILHNQLLGQTHICSETSSLKFGNSIFKTNPQLKKLQQIATHLAGKKIDMLRYAAFGFGFGFLGQGPRRLYLPSFEVILTSHSKGSGQACENALRVSGDAWRSTHILQRRSGQPCEHQQCWAEETATCGKGPTKAPETFQILQQKILGTEQSPTWSICYSHRKASHGIRSQGPGQQRWTGGRREYEKARVGWPHEATAHVNGKVPIKSLGCYFLCQGLYAVTIPEMLRCLSQMRTWTLGL